jgi:SAM-dependent methyltransferase
MSLASAVTTPLGRVARFARERGLLTVVRSCVRWGVQWLRGRPAATGWSKATFGWRGGQVRYFNHPYNYTWLNERAVETALALNMLDAYAGGDVLEIGNVTGHYVPARHTVVDKYERAPGVINADVAELELDERFDLILAVSTLEHVGLDEQVQDPGKPARAITGLKSLLRPDGRLWLTHPVGYNPALDELMRSNDAGFTSLGALRRANDRNVWWEVPIDEVWEATYDRLLYTAHGLVVAEYVSPG